MSNIDELKTTRTYAAQRYCMGSLPGEQWYEYMSEHSARLEAELVAAQMESGAQILRLRGLLNWFSSEYANDPKTVELIRALQEPAPPVISLEEHQREVNAAWANRDHFCKHINIIGKEILGPRLDAFKQDNCAPDAVSRETKKLVEKLELDLQKSAETAGKALAITGQIGCAVNDTFEPCFDKAQALKNQKDNLSAELYCLRQAVFKIGRELAGNVFDEDDAIAMGEELQELTQVCINCHGDGGVDEDGDGMVVCPRCNGTSWEPGLDLEHPPVVRLKEVRPLVVAIVEMRRLLQTAGVNPFEALKVSTEALDLPVSKTLLATSDKQPTGE